MGWVSWEWNGVKTNNNQSYLYNIVRFVLGPNLQDGRQCHLPIIKSFLYLVAGQPANFSAAWHIAIFITHTGKTEPNCLRNNRRPRIKSTMTPVFVTCTPVTLTGRLPGVLQTTNAALQPRFSSISAQDIPSRYNGSISHNAHKFVT